MAGETLYEQIAEHKTALNLIEGDDDGENNDSSDEKSADRSVRGQGGQQPREHSEQGAVSELGGTGDKRDSEGASRGKGGAPSGDARASQGDSGGTQKDGDASQKDGRPLQDEEIAEKPPASNAEWAKLRREAREAKAELAKLKAVQAAPAAPASTAVETKPVDKVATQETPKQPDKHTNYQEWLEWKLAQADSTIAEQAKFTKELGEWRTKQETTEREQAAIRADVEAFSTIEQRYIEKNSDYTTATDFARETYFKALKLAQPQATDSQINWAIDNEILSYARKWAAAGLDPAEEFYSMAQERFGYTPKAEESGAQHEQEQDKPPLRRMAEKPNLKVIANNKRRSASPLSGGGQGGAFPLTPEVAGDMSVGEFSRLTPAELADLEAQA